VLELFDESAGSHKYVKPFAQVCAVGPPNTQKQDTNKYREMDDLDSKMIQSPMLSLLIKKYSHSFILAAPRRRTGAPDNTIM